MKFLMRNQWGHDGIGIEKGAALRATLNGLLDYFGKRLFNAYGFDDIVYEFWG
jgi:hypothetical protein